MDGILTRRGGEDVTPEVTAQTPLIEEILESLVGKVYGANATPDKIVQGYSAYVNQNLIEGTLEPITGIDYGEVTLTAAQSSISVNHSLGVVPSHAYIFPKTLTCKSGLGIANLDGNTIRDNGSSGGTNEYGAYFMVNQSLITKTSSAITFNRYPSYNYAAQDYIWVALA